MTEEKNVQLEENKGSWIRPATDIVELADGFHIYMDMPGVDKDDLQIDLHDNELSIAGKTSFLSDAAKEKERQLYAEFGPCEYRRTFTLADTVDRDKIEAQLADGLLSVSLTKSERSLPKRIHVSVA